MELVLIQATHLTSLKMSLEPKDFKGNDVDLSERWLNSPRYFENLNLPYWYYLQTMGVYRGMDNAIEVLLLDNKREGLFICVHANSQLELNSMLMNALVHARKHSALMLMEMEIACAHL